ncbi:hypothetical protein RHGRI_008200 [Rhododendron griersonianum]|uniref:Enoyl reductase (ER) domain-containing protein n=1 Tax=Rhododendron griersonianum TaxID=479676 RepID=A0AAV6KZC3_9ERIC|nr:hypothetical protein RHGRI_008200 [Rhododendron griersonianum]
MEALLCKKIGDPTVVPPTSSDDSSPLTLSTSHPIPQLNSPTAIRVRVKATSLNYANYLQILGKYQEKPPLPFIPGSDYSGLVESVGPGVSKFRVGDPVCSFAALGSFAQFIVADESELFRVPDGCDLVAAGALPVAYGTSHVALVHRAQLTSGQIMGDDGILGVAGSWGSWRGWGFGCTNWKALWCHCYCCCQVLPRVSLKQKLGAEKVQFLESLGVDHVVDLTKGSVTESVKGFLKARKLKGVDVLYDPVGGKLTKETMKLLSWGAKILVIGFASGEIPVIPANIALVKNWTIHGLYWGSYKTHKPAVLEDSLKELLSWLTRGLITVHISHTYSLPEANLAFSALKDRKVIGKVMITFDDGSSARSKL